MHTFVAITSCVLGIGLGIGLGLGVAACGADRQRPSVDPADPRAPESAPIAAPSAFANGAETAPTGSSAPAHHHHDPAHGGGGGIP